MRGRPARIGGEHLLADNGLIHDEVLKLFGEVFAGNYRAPLPEIVPAG
jgi:myo-inositol-1(or 4)-monophosphatase